MKLAREMAKEAGTNIPTVLRMCGIQMHRENIRATPDEYCCQHITIQLLVYLLMELTNKFNEHTRKATVAIGNPERHMRKASHCGSKQQ